MSGTPQVIIIKWRKFIHDAFCCVAGLSGLVALAGFVAEKNFLPALFICVVSFIIACNIKFKYVKKIEAAGYKLV